MRKYVTQPVSTPGDVIYKAAQDLIKALGRKSNWLGDEQKHAIKRLSSIFNEVAQQKQQEWDVPASPLSVPHQSVSPQRVAPQRVATPPTLVPPASTHPVSVSPSIVEAGANMPQRIQQELQALECNDNHVDAPPAYRIRSRTRCSTSVTNMACALCTAAAIENCCVTSQKAAAR